MAKKNKDTCLSCNEARRRNDVRSCRSLIVVAGEILLSPCAHSATALQFQGRDPSFWRASMFTFCELVETGAACTLGRIYRHFSA